MLHEYEPAAAMRPARCRGRIGMGAICADPKGRHSNTNIGSTLLTRKARTLGNGAGYGSVETALRPPALPAPVGALSASWTVQKLSASSFMHAAATIRSDSVDVSHFEIRWG